MGSAVIPGQAEGLSPEPRADTLTEGACRLSRLHHNRHRFWVPGSLLRSAPE